MLRIYNSLTRKIEDFKPLNPPLVGMYTCGPTVYDFVHIGNFRTYTTADLLVRTLKYLGYQVNYIINITDVGHLTGDNLGDADIGEDRVEKAARREGKTAWDIAHYYEEVFKEDFIKLNLIPPKRWTRATDHIKEQIELVRKLDRKGFIYTTSDGVYFDTAKFPNYSKLSSLNLSGVKERARIPKNRQKRNPADFALWKFSYPQGRSFDPATDEAAARRQMEWDSPWGLGFPGWHIECSAMSMKYLGESFDLHVGGEDLAATHHPNEIAQSQAATGKPFVKYWLHGAFMLVEGKRMSKSLGNNYTLSQLIKKGFEPMALRYLYLQTHYRQKMNFTWKAQEAAQNALLNLKSQISSFKSYPKRVKRTTLSQEKLAKVDDFRRQFREATNDDLNMPEALAVVWETVKSNIPSQDKYDLLLNFDEILGLQLAKFKSQISNFKVPKEIMGLVEKRDKLRGEKKWVEADKIRVKIADRGFLIEDTSHGPQVKLAKKPYSTQMVE